MIDSLYIFITTNIGLLIRNIVNYTLYIMLKQRASLLLKVEIRIKTNNDFIDNTECDVSKPGCLRHNQIYTQHLCHPLALNWPTMLITVK